MRKKRGLPQQLNAFYHASPMREGVLCWYPFDQGASVLDLSGGTLTDLLSRSCGHMESDETDGGKRFDYIAALDPDDFHVDRLGDLKSKLNPHGRLLIAYENPFALRYWSGKRAPVTGAPYDTLFGLDAGAGVSKAELSIRLKRAGFEGQKWYYPLTDHWFTREVYSDNFLPDEYLNQRFIPYISGDITLQFDERGLYREVIRGGAFPFLCGAYLIEARACARDEPCTVDYAAVTAYREPAKRFATVVYNNGLVRKIPLHEDGRESIVRILRNHEELTRLGVQVVPSRLEDNALVMPRMALPTLWDYWVRKLTDGTFDEREMFIHFDRVREAIFRAAKTGKCFWELVPANCFYDRTRDEMTFFDQEYFWENVSPDVAVARAILSIQYSPALRADSRAEEWLDLLKRRYGLAERWNELSKLANNTSHDEVFGTGTRVLEETSANAAEHAAAWHKYWYCGPVAKKLDRLGFKHPAIYGFGRWGKALRKALVDNGVDVAAVLDKNIFPETPIELMLRETNADILADIVIVSIRDGEDIAEDLRGRLSMPVYTLEELLDEQTE